MDTIFKELGRPFPEEDTYIRPGNTSKDGSRAIALAYIDARAVMDRLDRVVGPENWQDSYEVIPTPVTEYDRNSREKYTSHKGVVICSISIKYNDEWITKQDSAEFTTFESVKGGFSDAFKRAAVKFGVGRYLYSFPTIWGDMGKNRRFVNEDAVKREIFAEVERLEDMKKIAFTEFAKEKLGTDDNNVIKDILNEAGYSRYTVYDEPDLIKLILEKA